MSTFYRQETINEVNNLLDIRRLMQSIDYRFDKFQENPKTAKGFCPIHREGLFRNLLIDKEARTFRCQYTQCQGSQGGNLVSLFAQAGGIDIDTAVRTIVRDQTLPVTLPVNEEMIRTELEAAAGETASGQDEAAEQRYLQVLEGDPNSAEAHHGLLKIYEMRGAREQRSHKLPTVCRLKIAAGKAADIGDLIQEWSELDPDNSEARFACAELLYAQGDAESAVMEFMGGGDACEGKGELDAALHAYQRAATISAEHNIDVIDVTPHVIRVLNQAGKNAEAVDYLSGLGEKAAESGNMEAATEFFVMAIEVEPDRGDIRKRFLDTAMKVPASPVISHHVVQSAQYLRDHDETDAALQALETYSAIAPDDENVLQSLINEYNNNGRAADAFDLEARLARLLYTQGRAEESQEIVERVLTWQPQHVAMLETLIFIQQQEGLEQESSETERRLIRALLAQKKYAEALDHINALPVDRVPVDDVLDLKAATYEGLGRAGDTAATENAVAALEELADKHLEQTTGRRAIAYLQRAVELLDSPPPSLLFKLARGYLRNRDFTHVRDTVITACETLAGKDRLDEAILEAERYSNLIPEDTDLVRYLVELYLRFDDKPAAVARMRRLADELTQLGRGAEAHEVLEQANDLEPQNLQTLDDQLHRFREAGNEEKVLQSLHKIASLHEEEGNFEAATPCLEEYLKSKPDDSAAIIRLIFAYDKLEKPGEARQWRLQLARVYRAAHDYDREARALRDVLSKLPDDDEALNMLINAEFSRGDMQAGVTVARRLTSLLTAAGKTEAARKTLMKAVERVPENLELNRDIYEIHRNARQTNQAITWGHKLINIYRNSGKSADAAVVFDQLIELDSANLALKQEQLTFLEEAGRTAEVVEKRLALADLYRKQERFADADAMLNAIVKADSRNLEARQQLADLHLHLGENAKAEAQFIRMAGIHHLEGESRTAVNLLNKVLVTNPASADARRQLSQIYRAEGNIRAAVSQLLELADVYRREQMEVEALAAEREAADIDANNTKVSRRFVDSLKDAGRSEQAADELERLARRLIETGENDRALATLNQVLELDPGRLAVRKTRAELFTRMGKTDEALKELTALAEMAVSAGENGAASAGTPTPAEVKAPRPALTVVKDYTFEHFVVGTNNDFAYATALAIARSPARAYNPLFLYANVGLGKTHLCNAIANYLLHHDPKAQIIYTNSEDFTDELVDAIQNNAMAEFRTRYRNLDLLIVDDVQFLAGKERAQEEFFHIFNSLFQAKRQIVITSDRPPSEISHLESRLRSRFGAGVIVDIASPDLETRLAILNREVDDNNLKLDGWISRLLSEKIDTNVRDLKGALNQVLAMRDLRKQPLTEEIVGKMIENLYPGAPV